MNRSASSLTGDGYGFGLYGTSLGDSLPYVDDNDQLPVNAYVTGNGFGDGFPLVGRSYCCYCMHVEAGIVSLFAQDDTEPSPLSIAAQSMFLAGGVREQTPRE